MIRYFIVIAIISILIGKLSAQTAAILSVKLTTSATSHPSFGTYNSVVVWVEDKNSSYAKTLAIYGINRRYDLLMWSNSNINFDAVDAVVGATKSSYGPVSASWNGTDKNRAIVADDWYTLRVELCHNNSMAWNEGSFKFQKCSQIQNYTPVDQSGYSAISLQWVPAGFAVETIEDDIRYKVFPNPALSTTYVDGVDIQSIDLLTIQGQVVKNYKEQLFDLSNFQKGEYLLCIHTH